MLFFLFHDLFTVPAHVALHATSFASMLDHPIEFAGRGNRRRVGELKLIARRDHIGYQRPIGEVAGSVDLINQAWGARVGFSPLTIIPCVLAKIQTSHSMFPCLCACS